MSGVRKDRQLREAFSGQILTADATPTNIAQITPTDSQAFTMWGMLTAHDTGMTDTAHWLFMLSGSRATGTTKVEEFKILNEIKSPSLVAVDFTVDLTTPVISFIATGLVATSIRWSIQAFRFDAGLAV